MTVYSSRRNIKRDRYCKRVIIIWRLRYRNTRVFFFSSFTFLHPLLFPAIVSLYRSLSSCRADQPSTSSRVSKYYSRNIREVYLYCTFIYFFRIGGSAMSLWKHGSLPFPARTTPVTRGTRYSRRRWRNPIFASGSTLLSATCWPRAETGVLVRERNSISRRACLFSRTNEIRVDRMRENEREKTI